MKQKKKDPAPAPKAQGASRRSTVGGKAPRHLSQASQAIKTTDVSKNEAAGLAELGYDREEALNARVSSTLTRKEMKAIAATRWKNESYELAAERVEEPEPLREGERILRTINEFSFWLLPEEDEVLSPIAPLPGAGERWRDFVLRGRIASLNGPARYLAMAGEFFVRWPTMESVPLELSKGEIKDIKIIRDPYFRDEKRSLAVYTTRYIYILLTPDFFFEAQWLSVIPYWEKFLQCDDLYIGDLDYTEARPLWWHGTKSFAAFREWKIETSDSSPGMLDTSRDLPGKNDKRDDEEGLEEFVHEDEKIITKPVRGVRKIKVPKMVGETVGAEKGSKGKGKTKGKEKGKGKAKEKAKEKGLSKQAEEMDEQVGEGANVDKTMKYGGRTTRSKARQPQKRIEDEDDDEDEDEEGPQGEGAVGLVSKSAVGTGPPKQLAATNMPEKRGAKRKAEPDNANPSSVTRSRRDEPEEHETVVSGPSVTPNTPTPAEVSHQEQPQEGRALTNAANFAPQEHPGPPLPPPMEPYTVSFLGLLGHPDEQSQSGDASHVASVSRGVGDLQLSSTQPIASVRGLDWGSGWTLPAPYPEASQLPVNTFRGPFEVEYEPADRRGQPQIQFEPFSSVDTHIIDPNLQYEYLQGIQNALHQDPSENMRPYDNAAPDQQYFA